MTNINSIGIIHQKLKGEIMETTSRIYVLLNVLGDGQKLIRIELSKKLIDENLSRDFLDSLINAITGNSEALGTGGERFLHFARGIGLSFENQNETMIGEITGLYRIETGIVHGQPGKLIAAATMFLIAPSSISSIDILPRKSNFVMQIEQKESGIEIPIPPNIIQALK